MSIHQLRLWQIWPILILTAILGCSPESSQQTSQESRVSEDNVFSDQVKALEKAEKLESVMQQHEQNVRESIEQQNQ